MSARSTRAAREHERRALAAALVRHTPRGAVRAAEALAATALNRRRRAARLWNGAFAEAAPDFDALFAALPEQPIGTRADAGADGAWRAICRRIAARALAGAGPDPARGAHYALPFDAAPPADAAMTRLMGAIAFYRARGA